MGVTLRAGFGVVVNGKVPGVPAVNVTVPVPSVAVNVSNIGFCVPEGVAVAWIGVLVAVITTGVLLGASVEVGRD